MTPTNELRFIERKVTDVLGKPYEIRRVLQQKWAHTGVGGITGYVWRDVPMAKENSISDPAEIRRVFELDAAEYPEPESGFMKL